jgi:hypothetical protein
MAASQKALDGFRLWLSRVLYHLGVMAALLWWKDACMALLRATNSTRKLQATRGSQ